MYREKIADIPIIQGGMGVGISRSGLAGAVAKEGGVGVISTAQIGYDEEGFAQDQAGCNARAIRKHIQRAKRSPAERPGRREHYGRSETLRGACERICSGRADVIISGAGLPVKPSRAGQ